MLAVLKGKKCLQNYFVINSSAASLTFILPSYDIYYHFFKLQVEILSKHSPNDKSIINHPDEILKHQQIVAKNLQMKPNF